MHTIYTTVSGVYSNGCRYLWLPPPFCNCNTSCRLLGDLVQAMHFYQPCDIDLFKKWGPLASLPTFERHRRVHACRQVGAP